MIVKNPTYVKVEVPAPSKFTQFMNGTLTTVTEEDLAGATILRDYMFYQQKKLVKVEIPNSVKIIGQNALGSCDNLLKVKMPKLMTSVGEKAFYSAHSLQELEIPEGITNLPNYFLLSNSLKKLYIPTTLATTSYLSFMYMSTSYSIYIKDLSKFCNLELGYNGDNGGWQGSNHKLYLNGTLITDLVTPDDCSIFGNGFERTTIITANLNKVMIIKHHAFYKATQLTSVTIGNQIEQIGVSAFKDCTSLTEIIINKSCTVAGDVPILVNTNAIPSTAYVYVPDTATQTLYKSATNWSTIADRILVKEA